jgi:predicted nucleic acid-binding protein
MAARPNLLVSAEVVDITIDLPQPNDVFMVDTNAWYWIAYSRFSQASVSPNNRPKAYQTRYYPAFIKQAISVKSLLHYCGLTLPELSHNIERIEKHIFCNSLTDSNLQEDINKNPKVYRHNYPAERAKVAAEVEASWGTVTAIGKLAIVGIDENTIDDALARFVTQCLDGYDLFLLAAMRANGIDKIITDDCDFVTVPDIVVFTANRNAIDAARNQGKLLER